MAKMVRINYTVRDPSISDASLMPYARARLFSKTALVETIGLLDSGASVNVLPYRLGCELGLDWSSQKTDVRLGGNLSGWEAKAVLLNVEIEQLKVVPLVFAWSKNEIVPLLFGQVNFFQAFDICFFRSQGFFTITSRESIASL